jgi:hypothetical protein
MQELMAAVHHAWEEGAASLDPESFDGIFWKSELRKMPPKHPSSVAAAEMERLHKGKGERKTTYEIGKVLHEAARRALGDKMPTPADNAPVWCERRHEKDDPPDLHIMRVANELGEEQSRVLCPDYTSASNTLPLLREWDCESDTLVLGAGGEALSPVRVVFRGRASAHIKADGATIDSALLALACKVFGVEEKK